MDCSNNNNFAFLSTVFECTVNKFQTLKRSAQIEFNRTEENLGRYLSTACRRLEGTFRQLAPSPAARVAFATMSRRFEVRTPSIQTEEIQNRISNVPVYLVAKENGKLVYIKPEEPGSLKKPIGLVFMNTHGAKELLKKIHTDVPEFARDTNVIKLDLGHLYELFANQKIGHLKNVIFRLVPDKEQVVNAMEVLQSTGRRGRGFTGVPVFHVNGLNAGENAQRPYFFHKEDLDYAIDLATQKKLQRDRNVLKDEIEILKDEATEARLLARQSDGKQAQNLLTIAARADTKSARLKKQLNELSDAISTSVQVEVRSLESLLSEMETKRSEEWDDIILIPSGLARHQLLGTSYPVFQEKQFLRAQNE